MKDATKDNPRKRVRKSKSSEPHDLNDAATVQKKNTPTVTSTAPTESDNKTVAKLSPEDTARLAVFEKEIAEWDETERAAKAGEFAPSKEELARQAFEMVLAAWDELHATPSPDEAARQAIASLIVRTEMFWRDPEIKSNPDLAKLEVEAARIENTGHRPTATDIRYMEADRKMRQSELEMLAIEHGRYTSLEQEIKDAPSKDQAFARLQFREIVLRRTFNRYLRTLVSVSARLDRTEKFLALLLKDPTIKVREPLNSALKKFKRLIKVPEHIKNELAVYDFGPLCLHCHQPFRLTTHKGELQRYCSNKCRQAAFRARRKHL